MIWNHGYMLWLNYPVVLYRGGHRKVAVYLLTLLYI